MLFMSVYFSVMDPCITMMVPRRHRFACTLVRRPTDRIAGQVYFPTEAAVFFRE